tara:strand:- start:321 stop:575 length:255 start_codon:yes stop_codon:yes gene_type:complete
MTSVNVTKTTNTVEVTDANTTTTVEVPVTSVVTATTAGPQGANAAMIDTTNAVNKSIVYYDGSSSSLKANNTWTTDTLTNGGNF